MPKIFLSVEGNTGVEMYRLYWPWKHLREPLAERGIELIAGGPAAGGAPKLDEDVFVYGKAPRPSEMPLFFNLRRAGKKLVWDLEDNYMRIPEHFNCYKDSVLNNTRLVLSMLFEFTNHVTVVSEPLKAFLEEHEPDTRGKITVLPNLLDAEYFTTRRARTGPARILWAGGDSHKHDLAVLGPVFQRIIAETDWTILYMGSVGILPDEVLRLPTDRLIVHGFTNARAYPSVLCDLMPDVGLCPLTGTEFDQSKTAIKWMEYTLAGAATVATDVIPYSAEIEHGKTGLLVPSENDPDAWYDAIGSAVARRASLALAAKAAVLAKHCWQSQAAAKPWLDFFLSVAEAA